MDATTIQQGGTYLEEAAAEVAEIDIYCWRMEQMLAAGYSHIIAGVLAENTEVDLHAACDLIVAGCPEATAYRILT
jgi:hypothetical protein